MAFTTHLTASVVPQVVPIDFEHTLIIHVHQLVYESMFHMCLAPEPTLTEYRDAYVGHEPSRAIVAARLTAQVFRGHRTSRLLEPFQHEHNSRA